MGVVVGVRCHFEWVKKAGARGGTTHWTHKGLADKLGMGKKKVIESIDALLDNGFIQLAGVLKSSRGSQQRLYRVVHPAMIDTVRAVMPLLPELPSETAKRLSKPSKKFL